MPTELVLVPMLFLLPTPVVPLVVSVSWALGRLIDYATGRTSVHRAFHVFGDCWHSVGPALVLVVAGAQVFSWEDWPVYAVALLRPVRIRLRRDLDPRRPDRRHHARRRAPPDGAGLRARRRPGADRPARGLRGDLESGPAVCLLVIPLAAVLAVLSRERQARIDQALELSEAYQGTALLLGDVVEADDAYTGSHSRGVVELSLGVADRLGLDSRQRRNVEFAALLHDVGKIAVPKEIINKPGPLDDEEWKIMHQHTIEGEAMLNRVGGVLAEVGRIVRSSHEHFDGSGYPDGLVGEEIPIEARIVTCCDAFSAMTTTRSYRKAMPIEKAIEELRACAGTQFDPEVAAALEQTRGEQTGSDGFARAALREGRLRLQPHRRGGERLHAQVAPGQALADQRRQAEGDRGGDLDRLQDHAVGERVGGADPPAGVEDADHGELEDADVRRGRPARRR